MTVIDRPWLFRDDDGRPRFKTAWHGDRSGVHAAPHWRGPIKPKPFEAHDAQTQKLIERFDELHRLPYGEKVAGLMEEWQWLDHMNGPAEKQAFLAPLIERARRAPDRNEATVIFLMLVCEGTRRGVTHELIAARSGLDGDMAAPSKHRREEVKRIENIERDRLHDVTRGAVLEALFNCPSPMPRRFFGWLRETVAYRTLDFLNAELGCIRVPKNRRDESEAIQNVLSGIKDIDAPEVSDRPGFKGWLRRVEPFWHNASQFTEIAGVRQICRTAVRRLPPKQQEVVEKLYYEGLEPNDVADQRGISRSTVYNHEAQALHNMYEDDCFFMALCGLRMVRDSARRTKLMARHPDGVLPDGRRIVYIDQAA